MTKLLLIDEEKIDFRLTTPTRSVNLPRHEQYRVEFW
jgi:hypothetical protein